MNLQEATVRWRAHRPHLEAQGMSWDSGAQVRHYLPDSWKRNIQLAYDAVPAFITDPNGGIPALLTTMIDPEVIRVLFTPNKAAEIFDERRKGTWLDNTAIFPVAEHGGEVSSYGDYAGGGQAQVNVDFPNRQAYLFQTFKEYGERELAQMGLAKLNWVSEKDQAAANVMGKFLNYTYFFGVAGLQNFGLLNDPNLTASITPATKAYGGTKWISGGVVQATANEIYTDIQSLFFQLVQQTNGLVKADDPFTLAMSPQSEVALTATNTFNVNVRDLLKKNFPKMTVETAIQYGVSTTSNTQGIAAGNLVQLIAQEVEGQDTGYCSFNEKMRAHPIIRKPSAFEQKVTGGTWGAIIRLPFAISSLLGV
jgi:Uncharacterized protein conserved in bacteria (DUF2184)